MFCLLGMASCWSEVVFVLLFGSPHIFWGCLLSKKIFFTNLFVFWDKCMSLVLRILSLSSSDASCVCVADETYFS